LLRRAWGLDEVKDRADDRHHALDALICAAAPNEWLLNTLTRQYQRLERENRARWVPPVPAPWEGFRDDALAAYDEVFVSRSEKRRGRGQGHKDTIYAKGVEDGQSVTYERKAVEKLSGNDLKRLKDADGGNKPLRDALRAWIDAGKPRDAPPTSPKGDPIRKVQLRRTAQSGFDLNGGHVDNADMVRVDVFTSRDGKGRAVFHMVPIYRHQVMDRAGWPHPPNQAITRGKGPDDWDVMGAGHEFLFSAYPDSYLEVTKTDGSVVEGYFRGANRNTNSIAISPHHRRDDTESSIGIRTAQAFRKFEVDRLGRKHEITRETRTWHGAVCT
jgi:CRISPR-associated endonuclease Csn1